MRLIGTLQGEQEAFKFSSFLKQEGIENRYDPVTGEEGLFEFWVLHEEQIETAQHWLEEFRKNSADPRFDTKAHPMDTQGVAEEREEPVQVRAIRMRSRVRPRMPLTRFIVLVCALLFIWNGYQMAAIAKTDKKPEDYTLTPL